MRSEGRGVSMVGWKDGLLKLVEPWIPEARAQRIQLGKYTNKLS